MSQNFIKGAMILSLSLFLTKILGIVYTIPFKALVGEQGQTLYGYAYTLYSLFISLSTLGIPVGMAKFVSKYQASGEYDTARKTFRYCVLAMIVLGFIGFLMMYFFAPIYVNYILTNATSLLNDPAEIKALVQDGPDIVHMIRVCSIALTVIPVMSIFRGFFQGNRNMIPTSISQLLEQVVRVMIILIGSFWIIKIKNRSYQEAVSLSVFAAFLSGMASFSCLMYYWQKELPKYNELLLQSVPHPKRKLNTLVSEVIYCSVPFAFLGLATSLYQNVDTLHFHQLLTKSGMAVTTQKSYYGMYMTELAKLIMIPVSFALAFGQPLVPELTNYYQQNKHQTVGKTIQLALRLTLFITLPAVIGISLLSHSVYLLLYPSTQELNILGGQLFQVGAWLGILYALYSIVCSILQGMNLQKKGIIYLFISIFIKFIFNQLLVPFFGINGFIYSTMIAYGTWIYLSYLQIKKHSTFKLKTLMINSIPILLSCLLMSISVILIKHKLSSFALSDRLYAFTEIAICGILGALIYFISNYLLTLIIKKIKKGILR